MVFSSFEFLFLFLPITILVYYGIIRSGHQRLAIAFLLMSSLFYYAYWNPWNTYIIVVSIVINYLFGQWIFKQQNHKKLILTIGVGLNLLALAYYKYTDFGISTLNALLGTDFALLSILLPIGISFFTFQQIAYLADIYNNQHNPSHERFIDYCCFVCFFPQLVAGPIVHHKEMMPQFANKENQKVCWENIYAGFIMLGIGLAKKVFIADNLSPIVQYSFDIAPQLSFLDALFGSLAYTFQLYFDFSAYSDMAIGCALFFNIKLPQNFLSPYRANNIQHFWQGWHITLSRWLRDYLYIPLGGNRHGSGRTLKNLILTFILGGLWHGAAWTFVLWGLMHGVALAVHRIWSKLIGCKLPAVFSWFLTFVFVNMAWIVFRATEFDHIYKFLHGFTNAHGFAFSSNYFSEILKIAGSNFNESILKALVIISFLISLSPINSDKILHSLRIKYVYTIATGILFVLIFFVLLSDKPTEFLYFQF